MANQRQQIGDWEGDTVEGRKGSGLIAPPVDRKSRYTVAVKVSDKSADSVPQATLTVMKNLPPEKIRTMTFDNGKEFAGFKDLERGFVQFTLNQYKTANVYFWITMERGGCQLCACLADIEVDNRPLATVLGLCDEARMHTILSEHLKEMPRKKTLPAHLYETQAIYTQWAGLDSNQRRLSPMDLQSIPFSHSGTDPLGNLDYTRSLAKINPENAFFHNGAQKSPHSCAGGKFLLDVSIAKRPDR